MEIIIKDGKCSHVEIYNYPDGQKNIKLDMDYFDNVKETITIKCSIRNFNELELLLCVIAALRKNDFFIECINFIYLFGMRSDRSFEIGMPNYFRDVVAPIINNFNIPHMDVFFPHSKISLRSINKLFNYVLDYKIPDAIKSYYLIGGDESINYPVFDKFIKKRENGKINVLLSKLSISNIKKEINNYSGICIIDDLCDAGSTFIEESKYLKKLFPEIKLKLFVMHGLFTKGIDHVADHFDQIITTNSYQEINHPKVKQIKVI